MPSLSWHDWCPTTDELRILHRCPVRTVEPQWVLREKQGSGVGNHIIHSFLALCSSYQKTPPWVNHQWIISRRSSLLKIKCTYNTEKPRVSSSGMCVCRTKWLDCLSKNRNVPPHQMMYSSTVVFTPFSPLSELVAPIIEGQLVNFKGFFICLYPTFT